MMNRLTERVIVRNFQSFSQVFFIIPRVENEYHFQFTIDFACSAVTIRFSWYVTKNNVGISLYIHAWKYLQNFIVVDYGTLEKIF